MKKEISSGKTGKKLSEKLHSVLLIHLTELHISPQEIFAKTVLVEFSKLYLEPLEGYGEKGNILR